MILNLFSSRPDHPLGDVKELKRVLADLPLDAFKAVDEVYGWYESASLHTGKPKIPKKVWLFLFALLAALALFWFAFSSIMGKGKKAEETQQGKAATAATAEPPRVDTTTTEYFLAQRSASP